MTNPCPRLKALRLQSERDNHPFSNKETPGTPFPGPYIGLSGPHGAAGRGTREGRTVGSERADTPHAMA